MEELDSKEAVVVTRFHFSIFDVLRTAAGGA